MHYTISCIIAFVYCLGTDIILYVLRAGSRVQVYGKNPGTHFLTAEE